jgi:hypothetical protein
MPSALRSSATRTGSAGHGKADPSLDPLHAMQFRASSPLQVSGVRPAQWLYPSDRDYPLHTARDRCLWHVGGTAGEHDDARTSRRRLPARVLGEARPR